MSETGRIFNKEKLSQMKSAPQKLSKWVQLKTYSERTTHQKRLGLVLNGKQLDVLVLLKNWNDFISSLRRTKDEMPKKCPQLPKIVKSRNFSLISQRIAIRKQSQY